MNSRDPILHDQSPEPAGPSPAAIILVPLGLVVVFTGLCLGLWLVSIAWQMLYHPDKVPLVSKVLELVQKDDVLFQAVQDDKTTRFEGAGVKYGLLLALLCVALLGIGSVIKAFLAGGKALLDAGLGRKPDPPPPPA